MFSVSVKNFRCFAEPPPVEIRPITFLVGENSAGKTSFLAATRHSLRVLSGLRSAIPSIAIRTS